MTRPLFATFCALLVGGAAAAASITEIAGIDPGFNELWVAEARYGNNASNGDWELGIGPNTHQAGQFDQAQFAWGASPAVYNFSLSTNGADTLFTVGDTTVQWAGLDTANFFVLRLAGFGANTNAAIDFGSGWLASSDGANEDVSLFEVTGFDLAQGLSGQIRFTFDGKTAGSRPAIQFKAGFDPNNIPGGNPVVPVPPAAGLVLLGVAALGLRRKLAKK